MHSKCTILLSSSQELITSWSDKSKGSKATKATPILLTSKQRQQLKSLLCLSREENPYRVLVAPSDSCCACCYLMMMIMCLFLVGKWTSSKKTNGEYQTFTKNTKDDHENTYDEVRVEGKTNRSDIDGRVLDPAVVDLKKKKIEV